MRVIIILLLIAIFATLASGGLYLIRDKGDSDKTVKALTWRVGLSIVLFIIVVVLARTGR